MSKFLRQITKIGAKNVQSSIKHWNNFKMSALLFLNGLTYIEKLVLQLPKIFFIKEKFLQLVANLSKMNTLYFRCTSNCILFLNYLHGSIFW